MPEAKTKTPAAPGETLPSSRISLWLIISSLCFQKTAEKRSNLYHILEVNIILQKKQKVMRKKLNNILSKTEYKTNQKIKGKICYLRKF